MTQCVSCSYLDAHTVPTVYGVAKQLKYYYQYKQQGARLQRRTLRMSGGSIYQQFRQVYEQQGESYGYYSYKAAQKYSFSVSACGLAHERRAPMQFPCKTPETGGAHPK